MYHFESVFGAYTQLKPVQELNRLAGPHTIKYFAYTARDLQLKLCVQLNKRLLGPIRTYCTQTVAETRQRKPVP